jgi:hypothetical protein
MNPLPYSSTRARWAALPRRTVRLRLTALYGALFLAASAGMLVTANIVARLWWPSSQPAPLTAAGGSPGRIPPVTRPVFPFMTAVGGHQVEFANGQVIPGSISGVPQSVSSPGEWPARVSAGHAAALNQLLAWSVVALCLMGLISIALGWLAADRAVRRLVLAADGARVSPAWPPSADPEVAAASAMPMSHWYDGPPDSGNIARNSAAQSAPGMSGGPDVSQTLPAVHHNCCSSHADIPIQA